jgi:hypothetical protein
MKRIVRLMQSLAFIEDPWWGRTLLKNTVGMDGGSIPAKGAEQYGYMDSKYAA